MRWIAVVAVSLSSLVGCVSESARVEPSDAGACPDAVQWCFGIDPGTCGQIVAHNDTDGAVTVGRVWCPPVKQ
jgi:hypothetical protein